MPITCPIEFEVLDSEAFKAADYVVMAQIFASHKMLGRLADENVYQADIVARLGDRGLRVVREVPVTVSFERFVKLYYLDFVVERQAVYELKTASKLTSQHDTQLMNYLLMLNLRHGKIVNLRSASVESRFVNAPMTLSQRREFKSTMQSWKGGAAIQEAIAAMVGDWGTGLELSLYHQAIVHLLGGEEHVTRQLPLCRDGVEIGNQRFHLMDEHSAFRVTAYEEPSHNRAREIARLVQFSRLRQMHGINISRSEVLFTSLL